MLPPFLFTPLSVPCSFCSHLNSLTFQSDFLQARPFTFQDLCGETIRRGAAVQVKDVILVTSPMSFDGTGASQDLPPISFQQLEQAQVS